VDSSRGWPASYLTLDVADEQQAVKHERQWTLAQIHQTLVGTDEPPGRAYRDRFGNWADQPSSESRRSMAPDIPDLVRRWLACRGRRVSAACEPPATLAGWSGVVELVVVVER
jgi:hypothetical protein